MEEIKTLAFFLVPVAIYLIPSIVAWQRAHKNSSAVCLVNIFFGWTILGWLIALIWSATDNTHKKS